MNINPLLYSDRRQTTRRFCTSLHYGLPLLYSLLIMNACSEGSPSKEEPAANVDKNETDTSEPAQIPAGDPIVTPSEPALPSYVLQFSPDATNLDGASIRLSAKMDGHDMLVATVSAHALTKVFGIAFHVEFDDALLELIDAQPADVMTNTLANGVYGASLRSPGIVVYGGARFHNAADNGAPVNYTGVNLDGIDLLTLTFRIKGEGTSALHFAEQGRSVRNEELKWESASWVGGTLAVSLAE